MLLRCCFECHNNLHKTKSPVAEWINLSLQQQSVRLNPKNPVNKYQQSTNDSLLEIIGFGLEAQTPTVRRSGTKVKVYHY